MTPYQKYQMQWMIDHEKSIQDLILALDTHRLDCDPTDDLVEVFWSWENDAGFNGELWASYNEWRDCEGSDCE